MAKKAKKRKRTGLSKDAPEPVDIYGIRGTSAELFSSGCTVLDCVLGGGWAYNRMANIVGDKSTGKTLLGMEAMANFAADNPDGKLVLAESESAFDESYARNLGLPIERVERPEVHTVEDVFQVLEACMGNKERTFVLVDSLDALSDIGEVNREMDKGTFGTKAKAISEWFRRQNQALGKNNITLMVISQLRDNIGVQFGAKYKRSGGHAMDFYATHTLWLHHKKQLEATKAKVKRVVGVLIRAQCKKNKVGPPMRECEFPLMFGFGVEDVVAGLDWLISVDRTTKSLGISAEDAKKLRANLGKLDDEAYFQERANITAAVKEVWLEIEDSFLPSRKKYR
jgi:recombination protein RecA